MTSRAGGSELFTITGEMLVGGKKWVRQSDSAVSQWKREDGEIATREHHQTLNAMLEDRERLAALDRLAIEASSYLDGKPRVPKAACDLLLRLAALPKK